MLPEPGSIFGRYLIRERLGRGGMGVVFAATHRDLGREVAIKLLSPELADDVAYRTRFLREAKTLAQLDTPFITRVYDAGEQDGWLFIATELVPDGDLKSWIDANGPASVDLACDLVQQVARGLSIAHERGILHRDIKPANVLLRRESDGRLAAVLCDLGIATVLGGDSTRTGGIVGTLGYMAPERHEGRDASVASDIYSLGCLLWALLTGSAPYTGTDMQVAMGHVQGQIPRVEGTSPQDMALRAFIETSMAKEPSARFASGNAAAEALAQVRIAAGAADPEAGVQTVLGAPLANIARTAVPPPYVPAPPPYVPPTSATRPQPVAYAPPQAAAPASRSVGKWVAIGLAVLIVLGLVVGGTVWALTGSSGTNAAAPPSPSPSSPTPSRATAQPVVVDPLHVGVGQKNLGCGAGYIVVLTSEEGRTPAATAAAVNRFPSAPDRHYLDPAKSCANLHNLTNKVNLAAFPYMGPFGTPVAACDARMAHLDTSTYVIGVNVADTTATYCACSYDAVSIPRLSALDDNPPRGNDVFWTLEVQYMLYDAGFNPRRDVGGSYDGVTLGAVQRLQRAAGLVVDGQMTPDAWDALKSRVC